MNMSEDKVGRLDTVANAKLLLDQWVDSLAQVLESMTDQRPEVRWQPTSGTLAEVSAGIDSESGGEVVWWEQAFRGIPNMLFWVAAPRATWEHVGTLTLKAAGLETVEPGEARNTWFEILGQSLAALARSIGSLLGREVGCEAGVERPPAAEIQEWGSVSVQYGELALSPLLVAFSPQLLTTIAAPPAANPEESIQDPPTRVGSQAPEPAPARSRTMDLLLDVDLPVSISFGKAQLPMKDVLKLTTGSIVELNRGVSEQVEVLVNQCLIARGEVVVIDGNYGVRIQEIASRQDRLRTLR